MLGALVIGIAVGALLMLVPLRRARRRAEAHEEEKQLFALDRQRVIDFMHLMAEALGENLSIQELRQRIVHASILCTGALSACIFERTAQARMRSVAVEGLFPPHRPIDPELRRRLTTRTRFIEQVLASEEFPVGEGIVGRVAQSGQPELIADAAADPLIVKHEDAALAVRSVIAVPLRFRDRFFGVLAVANPAADRPFTEVEFRLMQSLGEQAALALHNAEFLSLQIEKSQLDLDLSIASGIQQMLLPREVPIPPGLDVDARYTPAQKVGGDLYDLIPLPGGRLGVAIADVSGKGIPASLLMAIARTSLRQIALRHDSPARVLTELNRALAPDIHGGHYITMVYAVIEPAANRVRFARAGHELPLIAPLGEPVGFVGSEGMPIGMVSDELFSAVIAERTERFAAGDLLVLYTDGLTEAPNEDRKEFSGARLAEVVGAQRGRSAGAIGDAIVAGVRAFAGEGVQHDDLTLVTVKRV